MVGDELVGALADPRQVAHAELVGVAKSDGNLQAGRVSEGAGSDCGGPEGGVLGSRASHPLRSGEIEAEEIAGVMRHGDILTVMRMEIAIRFEPCGTAFASGGRLHHGSRDPEIFQFRRATGAKMGIVRETPSRGAVSIIQCVPGCVSSSR
jgi:hypothetical protein